MKRTLLFVLALAVIPVGVDAQAPDLEETRARAEAGEAIAQYTLGYMYAEGDGVPEDDVEAVRWFTLAAGTAPARAAASQVTRVAFQLIVNRPPGPSIVPVIVSPSISPL